MDKQFEILKANRTLILKSIEGLSLEQVNKVPIGFKNNIAWNVTHLIVTHQLLCYKLSGITTKVSDELIEKYQKGTSAIEEISKEEFENSKIQFLTLIDTFVNDYNKQIFKKFTTYKTSANVTLESFEDAVKFNNYHEGIHLGYILALKKMV